MTSHSSLYHDKVVKMKAMIEALLAKRENVPLHEVPVLVGIWSAAD